MHDNLADAFGGFASAVIDADSPGMAMIETALSREPRDRARSRSCANVSDPTIAPAASGSSSLPTSTTAIQAPTAELVTEPIHGIEPEGVRTADGVLHDLDVLVLATGFHPTRSCDRWRSPGAPACALADEWSPRPNAYLSISMPDFPNFFMINGPNGPVGNFSLIEVAEYQVGVRTAARSKCCVPAGSARFARPAPR